MMARLLVFAALLLAVTTFGFGCTRFTRPPVAPIDSAPQPAVPALFRDVASSSGLKFQHQLGDTGRYYLIEFTPPGCAFIDYNNDDHLDVFLVQSGPVQLQPGARRPSCALFRNNRDGTFSDVTAGSGLDKDLGYGHGAAVGDYDNDGYSDLVVTGYGALHLFRNRGGNGKFEDVSQSMGAAFSKGPRYATSAAWGDYNNDGRLDLYVCGYAMWSVQSNKRCADDTGRLDYCSPFQYEPEADRLWQNTGKGFVDVSARAGISKIKGRGLAVAFLDYDGDGRQDIFVANDLNPNILWRNNGDGTFTDKALESGSAYGENGKAMAGMGIAISDYDRSGRESLYVTNFSSRPNILFRNTGGGLYEDATVSARLAMPHLKFLSFGCEFLDYDADGWSDLVVNNGHVVVHEPQREPGIPREQRKQLLRNDGKGVFREIEDTAKLGDLAAPHVGRGLAVGDYDNDGRLDILASNQNAPAQLFHNQLQTGNHWISFKTVGTRSNRDGLHARLTLKSAGARQAATVRSGSSYLSASDRRVYFGLGKAGRVDELSIVWPSGTRETLRNLNADTFYTLTEGRGITGRKKAQSAAGS
jgi:hypothetical protein